MTNELGEQPEWVRSLSAALKSLRFQPGKRGSTPKESAVLILLSEGPDGVQVLLTTRALSLRSYPGQVTFPGGKKDSTDADPTATALREAREEVGLDPSSVRILGSLPTTVDPTGKSTVTPVLAWSASPDFPGPVNPKEVAEVHQVAIRELCAATASAPVSEELAALADKLGKMTASILKEIVGLLNG